jgi:hypothetical protein
MPVYIYVYVHMIDVNLEYMHRCESIPSRFLSICAYSY